MKKKIIISLSIIFILISSFFITYQVSNNIIDNKYIIASISNSKLKVIGNLKNNDISLIKVTAIGNNELIPYNIIWEGTNKKDSEIKYTIYKTSKEVKEKELKEPIEEGIIKGNNKDRITLVEDEFINSTNTGYTMYYYIKLESKEKIEVEGRIKVEESTSKPKINVIAAYVEKEDGTYEKKTESLPTSGYTINEEKSVCSNGAKPKWNKENNSILVSNLTKNGTDCYLYYDILKGGKQILADNTIKGSIDVVTGPSCESTSDNCGASSATNMKQNGIYSTEDDYGTSYVYRGTLDNNWLKFGKEGDKDIWWRIIRINGNGTIRLIYAGTTNAGINTAPSTIGDITQIKTSAYNDYKNDNKYVGYMYGTKRDGTAESEGTGGVTTSYRIGEKPAHANNYDSDIKTEIDNWYSTKTNLETLNDKIDVETGFCNDRRVSKTNHGSSYPGTSEGFGKTPTAYIKMDIIWQNGSTNTVTNQLPTLKCGDDESITYDLFTGPEASGITVNGKSITGNNALKYPVGLITMDEVIYAGGFYIQYNKTYWLYTNQNYWTMSPSFFEAGVTARMFSVTSSGNLGEGNLNWAAPGIRPVINLRADVKLSGSGLSNDPYIVKTE